MTILKGKVTRVQGWRAFIKMTSLEEKERAPLYFELPLDWFQIDAGDDTELRIGKDNVDVARPEQRTRVIVAPARSPVDALRDED